MFSPTPRPLRHACAALALAACFVNASLLTAAASAQAPAASAEIHVKGDIGGDWQGTLEAGKSLRLIVRISHAEKGWAAKFYSIDQTPQPFPVNTLTIDGQSVRMTIDIIGGSYSGTLSADGNTISGTWTQGPTPLPLTLVRATKETAWEIPAAPAPPKMMAPDANPSFDVATIKPNNSGAANMQGLTVNGRNFATRNSSLGDLVAFAFQVQARQIVNGPDWMDKDRYDIAAVPDAEGAPSVVQLRSMIQKLLADRFKLTFHKEKREMPAFVLTVAKTGSKLTPTQATGPLPGLGLRPQPGGVIMPVQNATMGDFSGFLQSLVLDRPVVNETKLDGRYDFAVKFMPDDSQFNGHPPPVPAKTDSVESYPSLFDAFQQQLGLKLEAQKAPVEVIVIDHAEKPSAN